MSPWIGVDFDGTLITFDGTKVWDGGIAGVPVPSMIERVRRWLAQGRDVRIFTARVAACGGVYSNGMVDDEPFAERQRQLLGDWSVEQFGRRLPVTAIKDMHMTEFWDDRAVSVEPSTGRVLTEGKQ